MAKRMIGGTRAQAAGSAAVFVAIIAALLVAFIILVNPQQRAELLGEAGTSSSSSSSTGGTVPSGSLVKALLKATPGRIDYFSQSEITHPLPVVTVQTKTEAQVLGGKNVAFARNGLFSDEEDSLSVTLKDLQNTQNAVLGFRITELSGTLIISVNGEEVLRTDIQENIKPIPIPQNLLRENTVINVRVSSPGAAFWRTNSVQLENLQLVADVVNLESQTSRNVFLVSEVEKKNLEKFVLKVRPQCVSGGVGKLTIAVNGREVYNGLPDCDLGLLALELDPASVHQGENEVVFSTERGMFILNNINLVSTLRSLEFPSYYFELSAEDYQKVLKNNLKARLALSFVDVVAVKQADIFFNGHRIMLDTKDVVFTVDVNDFVVEGSNAIKISPRKTLEVRELRLDLVK
ncbi:hypothetical protein HY496_03645 [Candidatus Woesearchaeota archaeon]|nr:hypothetical protein [Candidatus Woesearchaeota archaeon]